MESHKSPWFQTTKQYMILPYGGFLSHRATSSHPAIEDGIFHFTLQSMGISGSDWLEVPTIYKAYFSGLCKGISQQNMAKHMVLTYLHFRILKFPLIQRFQGVPPWLWKPIHGQPLCPTQSPRFSPSRLLHPPPCSCCAIPCKLGLPYTWPMILLGQKFTCNMGMTYPILGISFVRIAYSIGNTNRFFCLWL